MASIDPFGVSQPHRLESMGRYEHGHLVSQAQLFFSVLASKDSKLSVSVHLHLAKTMAET